MKKYIPFLLIASILLSACSIDWNDEKDKKITELGKQIQDDLFKKNKECSEFNEKKNWTISWQDTSGVIEVFYSPKRNSCVYIFWNQPYDENLQKYQQMYEVKDLLTNETIEYYQNIDSYELQQEFDQKIKELKWE